MNGTRVRKYDQGHLFYVDMSFLFTMFEAIIAELLETHWVVYSCAKFWEIYLHFVKHPDGNMYSHWLPATEKETSSAGAGLKGSKEHMGGHQWSCVYCWNSFPCCGLVDWTVWESARDHWAHVMKSTTVNTQSARCYKPISLGCLDSFINQG